MRILITGGAGFIGSHLADAYLLPGHEVAVVDDLSTGVRENLDPQVRFWQADIRSPELPRILADFRPEMVSHHKWKPTTDIEECLAHTFHWFRDRVSL